MFVGSYFAGSAPLLFSLSEEKLQRVSVLGAGLLVGTALDIIIPEGVQTLLKSYTRFAMAWVTSDRAISRSRFFLIIIAVPLLARRGLPTSRLPTAPTAAMFNTTITAAETKGPATLKAWIGPLASHWCWDFSS